ncbi:hypothetical protein JZ751_009244 [Albula glossodonta]|uniref:DNA topoisomerase n=1 Tax=Albula glossodonta TaxID=121402 RepID=A0A8T2N8K1_9TELE|nr:hypothetical protein JZ751_009244 [Albula glossodonta]
MRTVLMVAEKPSLAQSIAKILSKGSCNSRKGLNGACSVHEYMGSFRGQAVRFKMTSVCGKYNNWDKVDPAELFSKAPTEKKEANPKLNMVKFLQVEGKGCDMVVLWLDCDKEGENICFEVLDAVQPMMNKPYGKEQTVFRAKFSSITDTDICNAMNRLGEPNRNEALSTPTLGFCVERHDKIQSFKPEAYWVIQAKVFKGKESPVTLDWDRVRVFDREVGQMFVNIAKTSREARVESVSKKEKAKQRPQALNTVEMLRVASSALGMGPQHTMQIAERLYTQGYISYPRTETTHYPENFDLKGTLRQQANNPFWADSTTISFSIGSENFSCSGKTLISAGFTEVMPWQGITDEESLPSCEKGDCFTVDEVKLLEKQTNPPDYLTESELITLMEKHGIGTDASIPVHINNICQRNYVTVESGHAELVLPTIRSAVEKQLNLIAQGKANFHQVLQHTLDIFKRKFHYFVDSIAGMDELMEVSFSPIAATGKPLSRCGKCHRFMKYIQAKPSRLHCSHCDETYSLPQNGAIKLYKELRCIGCNECTHPTCQHSLNALGIGQCVECESGVLVFDPTSGPKWKMACNKCNVVVHFFEQAHKVAVAADSCESCEASLVAVDFNKARSPLPGDETQHTGCVFCDPIFQDLVELKHATMRHPMHRGGQARRQGGRGRGRGRRGGGGRGNPKKPKDKMAALAAYFV